MIQKNGLQLGQAVIVGEAALGHICHQYDGDYDFIGRKPQNKGHNDHAVNAQEPAHRVAEIRAVGENAAAVPCDIGKDPNQQTGRSRYHNSTPQDKKGAVQNGAKDDTSDFRAAVRRQFQNKGRGHAL